MIDLSSILSNTYWRIYSIPKKSKYTAIFLLINNETRCVPLLCLLSRFMTWASSFILGNLSLEKNTIKSRYATEILLIDEGWWSWSCLKLQYNSCFKMLRGSILKIELIIRSKGGQNPFFILNLVQKPPKCPKSIFREPLIVESCFTRQNDCSKFWFTIGVLRYLYLSDNWKCRKNTTFCLLGPCNNKFVWMYTLQTPRSAQNRHFLLSLAGLFDEISRLSIWR